MRRELDHIGSLGNMLAKNHHLTIFFHIFPVVLLRRTGGFRSPFLPLEPGHGFGEGDQAGSGSGVDDPWRKLGHQKNADAV